MTIINFAEAVTKRAERTADAAVMSAKLGDHATAMRLQGEAGRRLASAARLVLAMARAEEQCDPARQL